MSAKRGAVKIGFTEFVVLAAALMATQAIAIDGMLPAFPIIVRAMQIANENHGEVPHNGSYCRPPGMPGIMMVGHEPRDVRRLDEPRRKRRHRVDHRWLRAEATRRPDLAGVAAVAHRRVDLRLVQRITSRLLRRAHCPTPQRADFRSIKPAGEHQCHAPLALLG